MTEFFFFLFGYDRIFQGFIKSVLSPFQIFLILTSKNKKNLILEINISYEMS